MFFPNLFSSIRQRSYEKSARWVFFGVLLLAFIVFIPTSSVPFLYTKIFLLVLGGVVAFASYVFARLSDGNLILPPPILLGALWLVPAAYALSVLFSGAPTSLSVFGNAFGSDTFGFMLLAGFLGTLAALIVHKEKHFKSFFLLGAYTAAIVFLVQFVILVVGYFIPNTVDSTASIIGSFSDLAIFSGLSVIMTLLAFRLTKFSLYGRVFLCVLLALGLLFAAIGASLTTWILIALVALGLLVERIMGRYSATRKASLKKESEVGVFSLEDNTEGVVVSNSSNTLSSFVAPSVVLLITLIFIIGGASVSGAFGNVLHAQTSSVRPSWQSTVSIGRQTYATSAVFGSGPNTFAEQWLAFRNPSLNVTQFWNTNFNSGIGFIPTSFITTGIVGIIAWVILLALFIFFGLRAIIFSDAKNTFIHTATIVTFVGGLYVMLELLFAVPGPMIIVLGFVFIGMLASLLRYFESKGEIRIVFAERPRISFIVVFVLMVALIASLVAAYVISERYIAQVDLLRAQTALSKGDLIGADTAIQHSLAFAPSSNAYQIQMVIGLKRIQSIERNKKLSVNQARTSLRTVLSQTIASARTATNFNPKSYRNWYALGSVYQSVVPEGVSGAYDAAASAYTEAQKLNPTSPIIPLTLARLAISNKDYKAAELFLKKAIELKKDYTPAIFLFSRVEVQLGKAQKALQAAEAAAYFAPNNPTVLFQVGVLRELTGNYSGAVTVLSKAVKISPKYANARYSLAIAYAHNKEYVLALKQMKKIALLSKENAKKVESIITALKDGRNPFTKSSSKTSRPGFSGR